jgi:hypothetical protein
VLKIETNGEFVTSENTLNSVENQFFSSWDRAEQLRTELFSVSGWEWMIPLWNLIAELRERGFDKHFRAGFSMHRFVLSRSQKYGLRNNQSCLLIDTHRQGGMTLEYFETPDVRMEAKVDRVALTSELEQLLIPLMTQPID